MAQLSESLVRDAIQLIRTKHMHHLTINEIDQALWAWLMLNGHECCRRRPCVRPGVGPCDMPAQETGRDERCSHGYVISDTTHQCPKCGPV